MLCTLVQRSKKERFEFAAALNSIRDKSTFSPLDLETNRRPCSTFVPKSSAFTECLCSVLGWWFQNTYGCNRNFCCNRTLLLEVESYCYIGEEPCKWDIGITAWVLSFFRIAVMAGNGMLEQLILTSTTWRQMLRCHINIIFQAYQECGVGKTLMCIHTQKGRRGKRRECAFKVML